MKYLKIVILFCFTAMSSSVCFAESAADSLVEKLAHLNSMQANFAQQVEDGKGHIIQKSTGKFALLRPGKFRWETLQPTQQLLIADGAKIWIYDADLQQVTVQKQDNRNTNSPAMLLSGSIQSLKKNFRIQYAANSTPEHNSFLLKPNSREAMFQSVQLSFSADNLQAMRLVDNLGQASVLTFSAVVSNPGLTDSLFRFTAPAGVDIVDQTAR